MSMKSITKTDNTQGFVAIITAFIITAVLSVITISFVVVMGRERTQARDRQLSSQAFYAAESGVNYALKTKLAQKPECTSLSSIDAVQAVSVPCILVQDNPDQLVFDDVNTQRPVVFKINEQLNDMTITWQNPSNKPLWYPTMSATPNFPSSSTWGERVGVIEIIIYPIKATVNSTDLLTSARTYYLYPKVGPTNSPANVDWGPNPPAAGNTDGSVVGGNCSATSTPKHCQARITGMGSIGAVNGYVIRLRAIYNTASLTINGNGPGGSPSSLTGAQKVIDVTGKASDVLRRIQVRTPQRAGYDLPLFAIETAESLCKQLQTEPNNTTNLCP